MSNERLQQLQALLLNLLPADHTTVGNITLLEQFLAAAKAAQSTHPTTEDDFKTAREALVAAGLAVKGKGRGGSTARATGASRPDFALHAELVTPDMLAPTRPAATKANTRSVAQAAAPGEPQVLSYRHPDRRKNNPEVGLVNTASDPEQAKTRWAYDPHLDPALQFDSARARAEQLIDDALAGNDPAAMRHALESLRRMGAPYLQWSGKAERTSFEVDTVSLHVHERIDAMSILSAVSKRQNATKKGASSAGGTGATGQNHAKSFQPGLFEAPFESVPLRSALDFYKHERGWANRLVAGDSLLVMNSLLQKEGMAGQVQMIYIDPPYGIKYGSNFQPFTNKRDVKDRSDADLTQEPEMIKAFRDTWELGIHSYLTYLRDRLLLAKDLLSETGSVFVQIGDENVHLARTLLDEIFGVGNFVAEIVAVKTSSATSDYLSGVADIVLFYACDRSKLKYRQLFSTKELGAEGTTQYTWLLDKTTGSKRRMTSEERQNGTFGGEEFEVFAADNLTSQRPPGDFSVPFQGREFKPGKGFWKTHFEGFSRLRKISKV